MGRLRLWLNAGSQRVGTDATRLDHMHWSRAAACPLLQVPPALNRFSKAMDKNSAATLFKLLLKYKPEDKAAKKERLLEEAKSRTDGKQVGSFRPVNTASPGTLSCTRALQKSQSSGAPDHPQDLRPQQEGPVPSRGTECRRTKGCFGCTLCECSSHGSAWPHLQCCTGCGTERAAAGESCAVQLGPSALPVRTAS